MKDLADLALRAVRQQGASYGDIRFTHRLTESIGVKNGTVESLACGDDRGFGIRVIVDGAWGFASSSMLSREEVLRVAEEATKIARASALLKQAKTVLSTVEPVTDSYRTPVGTDPFAVKLEDKVRLLLEAEELLHKGGAIRVGEGTLGAMKERKIFASTEGSYIEQEITECGGGISALAVAAGEMQRRSYPNAHRGHYATRGFEFVEELALADEAERVGRQAVELLEAKQCPSGEQTLILSGTQLALQIHESCGHPVELDRVYGTEASYAGTSFLTPEKLGSFRYGSENVNITADATVPGGLGTYGYDDEGVPGQHIPIIEQGIFRNYLTSRETAPSLGQSSNGTMRADGWNRMPIIRMTNINLEPGDWSLEEMIKDTRRGLFLEMNKSWSIDDKRLNFQFGTEIGWEIIDGSLGPMVKNPTYTGITPQFWNSCDAVAGKEDWQLWGTPNCGKGEPGQMAHVGHGAAPARFRNVKAGVGKW